MIDPSQPSKQIVLRNDPSERNFAAVWKLMQEKRRAMPMNSDFRPRPRRTSGVIGIIPIEPLPPASEPILKPLSVLTCDAVEEESEEVTIPEVCEPAPVLVAGEDEPEQEETDDGYDSDIVADDVEVEAGI